MGVSLHYRGRVDAIRHVAVLCTELADIAAVMDWQSTILDDDWQQPANATLQGIPDHAQIHGHLGLKGIQITPGSRTESLSFFFDREGNLLSPMNVIMILDGTLKPEQAWISVKTQFAPPEIHVWIIGLLKYLKKRYISDLQVSDEGEYWETGNIEILKGKMALINEKLTYISAELSSSRFGDVSGLSAEQIAARIEQFLLGGENKNSKQ